jgi:group I intron endonuclease
MKDGVYQIVNTVNGKKYIGSGDIKVRWKDHRLKLNKNIHKNSHLQSAWNKYGKDSFRFDVIQYCNSGEEALAVEDELFDAYKAWGMWDEIYNIRETAVAMKHAEETKRKISATLKANPPHCKPHTEEAKRKMSEAKIGNKHCVGRVCSEETKRKLSEKVPHNKGKVGVSDETRRKMSESAKNRRKT